MLWPQRIGAKFAPGTLERISEVLGREEKRLDFIREAVEREIVRRKRQSVLHRKRRRSG